MFNRLGAKIYQWLVNSQDRYLESVQDEAYSPLPSTKKRGRVLIRSSDDHDSDEPGLTMRVTKVIGGKLIRFSTYDERNDRHNTRTYIIVDEADFEKELGKIITVESMRV